MSTVKDALQVRTDPLTRHIYATIQRRGFGLKAAFDFAGVPPTTWSRYARTGAWRTKALLKLAEVIKVPFEELVNFPEDPTEEAAA